MRLILLALIAFVATTAFAEGTEPWRKQFNETYKLEEGQHLRRIAPPFIPEREIYYQSDHKEQASRIKEPPNYFVFHWNGTEAKNWGLGFNQGKQSLRDVLVSILQMKPFDFELSPEIEKVKLDGDWIIDSDADTSVKLAALCEIIKDAGGMRLRFTEKQLPRNVLVVTGEYAFHPTDGVKNERSVHLFVEKPDERQNSGGGAGDLKQLLAEIGSRAGMQIIDEVGGDRPPQIGFAYHSSTDRKSLAGLPEGPDRDARIDKFLESMSKQTELQFKKELRMVSVWAAEPFESK